MEIATLPTDELVARFQSQMPYIAAMLLWKLGTQLTVRVTLEEEKAFKAQFGENGPIMMVNGFGDEMSLTLLTKEQADSITADMQAASDIRMQ